MTRSPPRNGRSRQDGLRHVRDQFLDWPEGHALAARFAVNADTHLDLAFAQLEPRFSGGGHGAGGQRHAHGTAAFVHPAAQRCHAAEIVAAGGRRAADLFRDHGHPRAAAARRVQAVLHRHVVIDDDRLHLDATRLAKFRGHFKIQNVAGVVLDDVEDAGSAIDSGSGRFHLVGTRGSEDLAGTGGIEHALADKSAVHGFVTAAAARNDAHLAGDRGVRPNHVHGIEGDLEDVGVGCGEPSQRFPHHILRVVDQFLHVRSTNDVPVLACPDPGRECISHERFHAVQSAT